jgi:hypothetical protein
MTRIERRMANKAAYAALRARYDVLPKDTRDKLRTEFQAERARNPVIGWVRYLEVVLPLIPADAR